MKTKNRVIIEGLSKNFGPVKALDGVCAAIEGGRLTGLVGPDGSGKTTFMRIVCGLMSPSSGSVTLPPNCRIGYMPQKFGLYEDLTVMENLNLYAHIQQVTGDDVSCETGRLLKFTGLEPFRARRAGDLSGGMKQKLGLACTMLSRPALLLLDEPSVGVDPISRRELTAMVKAMMGSGAAVLWSTAYLEETVLFEHVLLLNRGCLLYSGPPGEFSARTAGRVFLISGRMSEKRARLSNLLASPDVVDGNIQGCNIRVMTAPGAPPPDGAVPCEPCFEDSFIDALGGVPKQTSSIKQMFGDIPAGSDDVITAQGLVKMYGQFAAVGGIDFSVRRGEVFGLLGPNGAGKSTTFKMMCGLTQPTRGRCSILGIDLRHAAARSRIGYMAQKFSMYVDLTVRQNLEFFSGVYGMSGSLRAAAMDRVWEMFELASVDGVRSGDLSLGYKQRLAMACAVMHGPQVLFLDEPTSGVDPITRREFWRHIDSAVQCGVTVMVTTHFMDEVEYCDRIGMIYKGKLIAMGSPDEIKAGAAGAANQNPSMEDAFIDVIKKSEGES